MTVAGALMTAATAAHAQTVETVGVRAAGMGGAFVAVADDATAVYWNPGALAAGALVSAVAEHNRIDLGRIGVFDDGGPEARLQSGAGTLVALGVPPLGVAYYRLQMAGFDGARQRLTLGGRGTRLVTDNIAVNLLQSLADGFLDDGLAPADAGDVLDAVADLEGRSSWAFDLDAGLLVARGRWRAGLMARNLVEPEFELPRAGLGTPDSGEPTALSPSRQVRVGLAFLPWDGTTIAADADLTRTAAIGGDRRHVAAGVERSLGTRVVARGGFRANTVDDIRPAAAAGLSVRVTASAWIDVQATFARRGAERGWGVGLRVGL
jgi:hypothetical protein